MTQWQPIESAPKDGTPILLMPSRDDNTFPLPFIARWSGKPFFPWQTESEGVNEAYVTHWQPLPDPPGEA